MPDIIVQTVEYQGWGYNSLTVGTIGAFTFLIFETWGMYKQAKKIWDDRSAGVLSVHWFGYVAGFMLACVPYGIAIKSATITTAAVVVFIFHLPILWGIYIFRGYKKHEVIGLWLYALMLPAMVLLPWIDIVYLACSMGTIWAFASQPWEMWRAKDRGEVEIQMIVIFLVSFTFWTIYAFAVQAIALMILNPFLLAILVVTIILWMYYPNQKIATTN